MGGIEPRVGWPRGWQRVVGGGNGMNVFRAGLEGFAGLACFTDNETGVVTPVGFSPRDQMVGAKGEGLFTFSLALAHQVGGDIGEQGGRSGGTKLVGNDVQAVTLGG